MKGRPDLPLILDRLRPSKQLTSTQVLGQCAAMHGGTVQPINFSKPRWPGAFSPESNDRWKRWANTGPNSIVNSLDSRMKFFKSPKA